jgi:CDP-glucose 4,6-dehydratase
VRFFVTGGSGLIGYFLERKIKDEGHEWFNFDIAEDPGMDILDYSELVAAMASPAPDVVIHLAAISIVEAAQERQLDTYRLNIMGTVNVLEAAKVCDVKNVVVAASNHVYGERGSEGWSQEDDNLNATDPYSVSKICADYLTRAYAANGDMNTVSVRNTNVFGPADPHESHIVPGTIASLIRGERPIIRSEGKQIKSYLYGEDCAEVYVKIAENAGALAGQAINLTGCSPISTLQLVDLIIEQMGSELEPIVMGQPNKLADEWLDGSKLGKLGWEPRHTLNEGLDKTINWFKAHARATAGSQTAS